MPDNLNMRSILAPTIFLSSLYYFSYAIPTDPSTTIPQTSNPIPTSTARAFVNGTYYHAEIGEKLAVKKGSSSTINNPSITPTRIPANVPADDAYSIDFKNSDFKGSSYCSFRYKSFWYTDWDTDHTKRHAACDAVAYNQVAVAKKFNEATMYSDSMFWGPEKDGTNVCYWHFSCPAFDECLGNGHKNCGDQPEISYQNVQNM